MIIYGLFSVATMPVTARLVPNERVLHPVRTSDLSFVVSINLSCVAFFIPLSRQVVVLGTPAEEEGQGKVYLLNGGAFDDIDAAIMAHPYTMDGCVVSTNGISKVGCSSCTINIFRICNSFSCLKCTIRFRASFYSLRIEVGFSSSCLLPSHVTERTFSGACLIQIR